MLVWFYTKINRTFAVNKAFFLRKKYSLPHFSQIGPFPSVAKFWFVAAERSVGALIDLQSFKNLAGVSGNCFYNFK
jgi:hypothetical protein